MTSTFKLQPEGIPVTVPKGVEHDEIRNFHPFNNWYRTLQSSLTLQSVPPVGLDDPPHPFHSDPYILKSITVQAVDRFTPTRIGFVKLQCDVSNSTGQAWLPGAVFLRGQSVAVLFVLVPEESEDGDRPDSEARKKGDGEEERYVVLTVQPRVAAGSLAFVEVPAGMVDEEGAFAGTAAKELKEELDVEVREDELVCLTDLAGEGQGWRDRGPGLWQLEQFEELPEAMYPSVGACDESIRLYYVERRVPRAQLAEWTGRLTGLREEGERITLKLVPWKDAWKALRRDAKGLAALALWEGLTREGKLKGRV